MTIWMQFSAQSLVHAMGWTLLHFCWQGAAVALALWCALGLLPARWPRARYGATCLALVLMATLPGATFMRLAAETRRVTIEVPELRMEMVVLSSASTTVHAEPWLTRLVNSLDEAAPWIPAIWLTGVILFLGRLNLGLVAARRMRIIGTETAPSELQLLLRQIAGRLRVERAVQLMHSAVVQVPTVVGWLRPVILLPVGCFAELSQAQMETLLAHELAHIRRHDYLVSVFQSVVEALLFYHPAVWWVSCQVRQERECCCDELAVGMGGDRLAYARALSFLEERRAASPAMVLGANGGVLTMRIKRLLGLRANTVASQAAALALLGVVVAVGCSYLATVARAQPKSSAVGRASVVHAIQDDARVELGAESAQDNQLPERQRSIGRPQLEGEIRQEKETLAFLRDQLRDAVNEGENQRLLHHDRIWQIEVQNQKELERQVAIVQEELERNVAAVQSGETGTAMSAKSQYLMPGNSDDVGTTQGVYKTWLLEDVRWIITDDERAAYVRLANDDERDMFITQFWARRDRPGTAPNAFREEHYARIAYVNQHFGTANLQGWRSDRGHIYIAYGKPDSIDAHPSNSQSAYPFEIWHYNAVPGVGENVDLEFVDTCRCGEFHYTTDRAAKDSLGNPDALAQAAKVLTPPAVIHPISFKPSTPQSTASAPDQALFDNGVQAIKESRYDAGRMDLQTLINMYPSSQFVQRARLAIAASWEKQGGSAALAEADKEYAESGVVPKKIGGSVSAPVVIYQADPASLSDEVSKAKITGIVVISLWVDEQGNPTHVKLMRAIGPGNGPGGGASAITVGWGLDGQPYPMYVSSAAGEMNEKAVEAVRQYKFKPAMENGKPVVVELNIEINFKAQNKLQ